MRPQTKATVLIVGAGPTGLMAACELARRGVDFRIIDKAPEPSDKSKALAIHARSLELLDDLGIADSMIDEGLKADHVRVYADNKLIVNLSLDELDSPFPFSLILPQSRTEAHLARLLSSLNRKVDRAVELVAIENEGDHVVVQLKMADGSTTQETYDWLVACDGAHSAARHSLKMPFTGGAYEEGFLLADAQVDFPSAKPQEPIALYTGKETLVGIFRINSQITRIICVVPSGTVPAEPTLEDVQRCLKLYRPELKLHDPIWVTAFKVSYRQVDQYRHGRVLIAGDAAHIHSPAGGQGMNTGLQDAVNLAWKLALVVQEEANERLLDSYHSERHAVAEAVLKGTNFLTRVNIARNPIGKELRKHLAPILIAQEVVQNRLRRYVSELNISYKSSPIVFQHQQHLLAAAVHGKSHPEQPDLKDWLEFGSGPSPGERAPDAHAVNAKTGQQTRLFDACRGVRHTLVLLAGEHAPDVVLKRLAPLAHAVEQKFCRLVHTVIVSVDEKPPEIMPKLEADLLLDHDLSIHHKYGAGSACGYLIRPDGYVGYRGQPPELSDIEKYFHELLGIEVE